MMLTKEEIESSDHRTIGSLTGPHPLPGPQEIESLEENPHAILNLLQFQ